MLCWLDAHSFETALQSTTRSVDGDLFLEFFDFVFLLFEFSHTCESWIRHMTRFDGWHHLCVFVFFFRDFSLIKKIVINWQYCESRKKWSLIKVAVHRSNIRNKQSNHRIQLILENMIVTSDDRISRISRNPCVYVQWDIWKLCVSIESGLYTYN